MSDSLVPKQACHSTPAYTVELDRLCRLIEGLLDADILLIEEGGALLEAIESTRQCHRRGDLETARRHTTRLGLAIEALVRSGRIEQAHGRAALEWVDRIVHEPVIE